jgi:hypothetical protein
MTKRVVAEIFAGTRLPARCNQLLLAPSALATSIVIQVVG